MISGEDPVQLWAELVNVEGSLAGEEDLLKRIRTCGDPTDSGDTSRRIPVEQAVDQDLLEPEPTDASDFYDSPDLQRLHEYMLKNRLSSNQADELIHLMTDVFLACYYEYLQ